MKKIVHVLVFAVLCVSGLLHAQNCGVRNFPHAHRFDGYSTWNSCWTVINANNDSTYSMWNSGPITWKCYNGYAPQARSGNCAFIETSQNTADDYLVSPKIYLSTTSYVEASFWTKGIGSVYQVLISRTGIDSSDFQVIFTDTLISNEYRKKTVSLTSYLGDSLYFAIRCISPAGRTWPRNQGYMYVDDFEITYTNCVENDIPDSITATHIGFNQATVHWVSPAANFDLLYGPSDFNPNDPSLTPTYVNGAHNYTLTHLTAGTPYYVYIRANCGDGAVGFWSKRFVLATECMPYTTPVSNTVFYATDFETWVAGNEMCWKTIDNNPNAHMGEGYFAQGAPDGIDRSNCYAYSHQEASDPADDWLISPKMQIPANQMVKLFYKTYYSGSQVGWPETFSIKVSTNGGSEPSDFTHTVLPAREYQTNSLYDSVIANLSAFAGQSIYIAIHVTSRANRSFLYFDNFSVENKPECMHVQDLFVTNIATDSASVQWISDAAGWEISYQADRDFNADYATDIISLTDPHYTLMGLTPSTDYYVYVRSVCGNTSSPWQRVSFRTSAGLITADQYPWTEDFQSWTTSQPLTTGDWTIIDGYDDLIHYAGYSGGRIGTAAYFRRRTEQYLPHNEWMISPQFQMTGQQMMEFWVKTHYVTNELSVWVSTTGTDSADFTTCIWQPYEFMSRQVWTPVLCDLTQFAGQNIYIAIRNTSTSGQDIICYIDDFQIRNINASCDNPKNIVMTGNTLNSVDLTWVGNAPGYTLKYCSEVFLPDHNSPFIREVQTAQPQITLQGLTEGSMYYVYIRSDCNPVLSSEWIGPIRVYTYCDTIYRMPYVESFNDWYASGSYSQYEMGCWKFVNHTNRPEQIVYGSNYVSDILYPESRGARIGISNITTDIHVWLISPKIQLGPNPYVEFWFKGHHTKERFSVLLSTTGTDSADFRHEIYRDTTTGAGQFPGGFKHVHIPIATKDGSIFGDSLVHLAFYIHTPNTSGAGSSGQSVGFVLEDFKVKSISASCVEPTNFDTDSIGSTTARLHWNAPATIADYTIIYDKDYYFDPDVYRTRGTRVTVPNTNNGFVMGTISGLQPGTQYWAWVKSNCGSDSSNWVGPIEFYTECDAPVTEFPYLQEFENWNPVANYRGCWKVDGTWGSSFATNNVGRNKKGAQIYEYTMANRQWDQWLITPEFALDTNMYAEFYYKGGEGFNTVPATFMVVASTTGDQISDFTDTLYGPVSKQTVGFEKLTLDLSAYDGRSVRLAIAMQTQTYNANGYVNFIVDDFSIKKSYCPAPGEISIFQIDTYNHKIELTWTNNTVPNYEVRYSDNPFDPETSLTATTDAANSNFYAMENLQPGKNYYFRVRSDCDGTGAGIGQSIWSNEFSVAYCNTVTEFPYVEEFSDFTASGTAVTPCWKTVDGSNNGIRFRGNASGKAGNCAAYVRNGADNEKYTQNDWLISPQIELPNSPMLEFWYKTGFTFGERISVLLSTTGTDTSDFVQVLVPENNIATYGTWSKMQIDLTRYASQPVYIAFHLTTAYYQSNVFYIDQFSIFEMDGCPPITEVSASPGTRSASLSWVDGTLGAEYRVIYKNAPFDPQSDPLAVLDSTGTTGILLSGLTAGQSYWYYLYKKCSNSESTWMGPYTFQTDCGVVTDYNYTENFNSFTYNYPHRTGCWEVVDGNNDSKYFIGAPGGGIARYYDLYSTDTINEWLISPAFLVPEGPQVDFKYQTGMLPEEMSIRISTTTRDTSAFVYTLTPPAPYLAMTDATYTGDLSQFVGDTIYIAVHLTTGGSDTAEMRRFFISNFHVTTNPCAMMPSNVHSSSVGADSAIVSWTATSPSQNGWDLMVYKTQQASDTLFIHDTVTSVVVRGLTPGTSYTYRVRTSCGTSVSSWTAPRSFSTAISCWPATNLACSEITSSSVVLSWVGDTAAQYEVSYKPTAAPHYVFVYTTGTAYTPSALSPSTEHQWRVRKVCGANDTSIYAAAANFTTLEYCDPAGPVSSVQTTATTAHISWTGTTPSYRVQYRVQGASSWISLQVWGTDTLLTGLLPVTNYQWRIQGMCASGSASVHSGIQIFVTAPLATYSVTAASNDVLKGVAAGSGMYQETSEAVLVATPVPGYLFYNWTAEGVVISTSDTLRIRVISDTLITANFDLPPEYTVTVRANEEAFGSVTGGGEYVQHTQAVLTAAPNDEYTFEHWASNGTVIGTDNPLTITVISDTAITANFAPLPVYTVTVTANNAAFGTVSGGGEYIVNRTATLTATPHQGYSFIGWMSGGNVLSLENPYTFTVVSHVTVQAVFQEIPAPPCAVPANLSETDVTGTSATLQWSAEGTTFQVAYKVFADAGWSYRISETLSTTVSDLSENTPYVWKVRNLCGAGDTSQWSNENVFTTRNVGIASRNEAGITMTLHPNPATHRTLLTLAGIHDKVEYTLTDISGRTLAKETVVCQGTFVKEIPVHALPKGTYFVRMQTDTWNRVEKLLIQ